MATTLVDFDRQTEVGRKIARCLQMVREGRDVLRDTLAVMDEMKDGDGSQASHFALLASEGGFQQGGYASASAAAKASYDELNSLYFKLNVTSLRGPDADEIANGLVASVGPAITQACARHGV